MSKGRPEGAKNVATTQDVQASACPQCHSTERTPYMGRTEQIYSGEHQGRPYNRIVRRRCQCTACGQTRIDRSFEYDPT